MAANARQFASASNHKITLATGSIGAFGSSTFAAIVKIDDITATKAILSAGTDPNSWSVFVESDESIGFWNGSGVSNSAASQVTTGVWYLVACTKVTGAQLPRFHVYNYTTPGWFHGNGNNTRTDSPAPTTAWIGADVAGGTSNDFNGAIQACAYWTSTLSDGNLESMVATKSSWTALSPAALWVLNQDDVGTAVQDEIGGADQTAITGTTVVTGNPDWDDEVVVWPDPYPSDASETLRTLTAARLR